MLYPFLQKTRPSLVQSDNALPTVVSIGTASPTTINLILSEEITDNSVAPGDFVLSGTIFTNPTVNTVAANGDTVTLTLSDTLDYDDIISLAYTKNTGSIDDTASPSPNSLASFAASPVTNNITPPDITPPDVITPPRITAASVDSADTITVTYNENVDVSNS